MFRNYLKIGIRNLIRQKAFSLINILGLAVGLACGMLIILWIKHELSYDQHHRNADQIYRLTAELPDLRAAITPAPMAPTIQRRFPEVDKDVRLSMLGSRLLSVNDQRYEEDRIFHVDSNFLDFFNFPLKYGDPFTALLQPQSVVITEAMALKYFGSENAVGNTIKVDHKDDFVVSGELDNSLLTSHLQFDFLMPLSYLARTDTDLKNNRWDNFDFYGYVKLNSNASARDLTTKINLLYQEHESDLTVEFNLQSIKDIHLKSDFLGDVPGHGNIQYVYIFSIIAIFIMIIACINFMNLSTARSTRRAREVGFRKVAGARRGQLIAQFLVESCVITYISLLIALAMVFFALPSFNEITGKEISIDFFDGTFILAVLLMTLMIGLLSGSYPALYLSGILPFKVINLERTASSGQRWFRDGLVITQFVFSIVLIIGTVVIRQQQQFIKNQNLGFDRENLLYMTLEGNFEDNQEVLTTALSQNPFTENFSIVSALPTDLLSGTVGIDWEGKDPEEQVLFANMQVDEGFIDVFQMQMASGRSFLKEFQTDEGKYLLNERALQAMGMDAKSAVGKSFTLWEKKGTIVGVVKDFHFKPIKQPIDPIVIRYNEKGNFAVVRTQAGQTALAIQALEEISQQLNPNYPFDYGFVDHDLDNLYQSEARLGQLVNIFAILAILISCLGLYGLSAFLAEQRRKEVGVRKVVGASVIQLGYLLARDFTKPIWIAMLLAMPIAYFYINKWLQTFAYHIDLTWSIMIFSCLLAWTVALLTVSFEAVKVAIANPILALRGEL